MKQTPVASVRPWESSSKLSQTGSSDIMLLVLTTVSLSNTGQGKGTVHLNSVDVKFRHPRYSQDSLQSLASRAIFYVDDKRDERC
jgi:hypothetical protein